MEIQVGEYVRTKLGIGKIVKTFQYDDGHKDYYTDKQIDDEDNSTTLHKHQIVKHSKNIIDLIEVGDYVNGKSCIDIEYNETDDGRRNLNLVCLGGSILELNNNIKSIVTHEQFSQVEYEV